MKGYSMNQLSALESLKRLMYRRRDGELILRNRFKTYFDREFSLESPVRFSDKLFSRMILLNRGKYSVFSRLSDKYAVREYVSKVVGDEYLTKLYWIGHDPLDIPFDSLPNRYVLKTNHGSGGNIFVSGDSNREEVVSKLSSWLRTNYYWEDREFQYFKIKPCIIIEEFLNDECIEGPLDYRFWCFDGEPRLVQVDNRSHAINPFYDLNWNKTPLSYREKFEDADVERPKEFELMVQTARSLGNGFDFVRVDLYNISGRIVFGELTFTPVAGRLKIRPEAWDKTLGEMWKFRVY